MRFESVTRDDLEKIRFLQPDGWSDIVPEFEAYLNSDFCFPVKAEIENRIVGVGAAIALETTGWLAHIIVDTDQRNRGIGFKIVEELVRILREMGINTFLLIATALGKNVYLKAGFRVVTEYIFFKRENPWIGYPLSGNILPYSEFYFETIMSIDREICGENREALLKEKTSNSLLFINEGKLQGYYIPGIGEGLIVADNERAGIELMKIKYANADKAVIPVENTVGIRFLKENGFLETETKGTRMILGDDIVWKPEMIFSRIAGNFG